MPHDLCFGEHFVIHPGASNKIVRAV